MKTYNEKTGNYEEYMGRGITIIYPTCPYEGCNFHDKCREEVIKHIENKHE